MYFKTFHRGADWVCVSFISPDYSPAALLVLWVICSKAKLWEPLQLCRRPAGGAVDCVV